MSLPWSCQNKTSIGSYQSSWRTLLPPWLHSHGPSRGADPAGCPVPMSSRPAGPLHSGRRCRLPKLRRGSPLEDTREQTGVTAGGGHPIKLFTLHLNYIAMIAQLWLSYNVYFWLVFQVWTDFTSLGEQLRVSTFVFECSGSNFSAKNHTLFIGVNSGTIINTA